MQTRLNNLNLRRTRRVGWHPGHNQVTLEMILDYLRQNVKNAKDILKSAIPKIGKVKEFAAGNALATAGMTNPKYISEQKKTELKVIIGKYLK